MQALRDIAPYAALAAVALSIALLVLLLVLWSSVRRVRRSQLVVMGHHEQRDIVAHVESLDSQVRNLLDDRRSGVVFSAIAARDFARIYVKHLRDGVADRHLSPEEEQAVAAAVPRPPAARRRSRRPTTSRSPGTPATAGRAAPAPPPAPDARRREWLTRAAGSRFWDLRARSRKRPCWPTRRRATSPPSRIPPSRK